MEITRKEFGKIQNKVIYAYTLKNHNGMSLTCINYGCVITDILTPDRNGMMENVVLGFDQMEDYLKWSPYFGAVIGRVAGRINNSEFMLDNQVYQLTKNENNNHLHGGSKGFSDRIWNVSTYQAEDSLSIEFTCTSSDGEEGYPGELSLTVKYELTNKNELVISYQGFTDKKTIINMTNHSYFNLSGNLKDDILHHTLKLNSRSFLELDEQLLPTGRVLDAEGTVFDFQNSRMLKEGITSSHPQVVLAGAGYDHPFILSQEEEKSIELYCESSGRKMRIETDQPSVVLYTGNQLSDDFAIRGVNARKYLGLCLETQGFPDAINHSNFPSIVLNRGKEYHTNTKYIFSVD